MVGMVATPFVVALVGWLFRSTLKTREVEAEYASWRSKYSRVAIPPKCPTSCIVLAADSQPSSV
jgi:hypothetical protein